MAVFFFLNIEINYKKYKIYIFNYYNKKMDKDDDIDIDLDGIATLLRSHISIRNRTWMKRVHRDCFIGSEAVDFLFSQGRVQPSLSSLSSLSSLLSLSSSLSSSP